MDRERLVILVPPFDWTVTSQWCHGGTSLASYPGSSPEKKGRSRGYEASTRANGVTSAENEI